MKETGIICSGNHPKLILDDLKTMTRRTRGLEKINECPDDWKLWYGEQGKNVRNGWLRLCKADMQPVDIKCPYGQVGDRLWVMETWSVTKEWNDIPPSLLNQFLDIHYKDGSFTHEIHAFFEQGKWRPSIHMPRWASRIERIITLLRVERLRAISEADAKAEGGYSIEEFIELFLRLNHLPKDVNPWNWVIGW